MLAERPDVPGFVCCHHPPVALHGPSWTRSAGSARSGSPPCSPRHPQVVALLCGHAHTPATTTFAGRPVLVAPGVVSTLVLPWEHGDLVDEGPVAVASHVLGDDGGLTTHYRFVR